MIVRKVALAGAAVLLVVLGAFFFMNNPIPDPVASTPETPVSDEASPPDQEAPAVPVVQPDRQAMLDQLKQFAETYYRVRSDDSTASRRAAVEALPFVIGDDAAANMDFTVYVNSDSDQYRINNQLTAQGTIDQAAAQVASEQQEGRLLYMTAPVTIITTWPDGRTQEVQVLRLGTVWQYQPDGSWSMAAFGDDGGFQ